MAGPAAADAELYLARGPLGSTRPFLTAPLRRRGVSDALLDSPALFRPTRGVRAIEPPSDLVERAAGLLPVLPFDAGFSHVTAAQLLGLPLSYAVEEDDRLHVTAPLDTRRMRRPDVVAHRALHPRHLVSVAGLPVVAPADTWVDMGELAGRGKPVGLDDLVVLGDAVATRLNRIRPLRTVLAARVRPRGKVTLVEALSEIRLGAASPRETLTRLMLVRCGLPEPLLGRAVISSDGDFLGVADLLWEEERVVGEYQGEAFHDAPAERKRDAWRRRGFERRGGYRVEEVWRSDLSTTPDRRTCVLRFATALGVPTSALDLDKAEPRFFSSHAIELAIQRDMMRRR